MKKLIILFAYLTFFGSISFGSYGSEAESIQNRNGRDEEIILSNTWQICVNHRVSTKGETFAIAGAWCDQHFTRVELEVPVEIEEASNGSNVSL